MGEVPTARCRIITSSLDTSPPHCPAASPPNGPTAPLLHHPITPSPHHPITPSPHHLSSPPPISRSPSYTRALALTTSFCPSLLQHGRRRYRCADCKCVRGAEGLVPLQDEPQCPICLDLVTVRLCEEGTSATRSTRSNPAAATGSLKAQCCGNTYHLSCLQANQLHSNASEAPCPVCRSTALGRQVRHAARTSLV